MRGSVRAPPGTAKPAFEGLHPERAVARFPGVTTLAPTAAHQRTALIERAGAAESVQALFRAASERLRRLVPADAAVWLATDPATSLPTTPTRTENMGHFGGADACRRLWELEFLVEDVNLYRDLAQSEQPAAGLRMSTEGSPARSPRYRQLVQPSGFADELRAVLRVGGQPWAVLSLFRADGRPAFDADERDLVAGLSGPLAEAIRAHARREPGPPEPTTEHGPGLRADPPRPERPRQRRRVTRGQPTRSARKPSQVRWPTARSGARFAPARNARAALPGSRSGTSTRCLRRART